MVRIGSSTSSRNRSSWTGLLSALDANICLFATIIILSTLALLILVFALDISILGRGSYKKAGSDKLTDDLISWLKSNGAFIDERIILRHTDPTDPTSIRGMFADHGSFEKGETLFTIPNDLIYDGKPRKVKKNANNKIWKDRHSDCGTTYEIHNAMLTGNTPYGRYLAHQPRRYVPGYWSPAGRELLGVILGEENLLSKQFSVKDRVQGDWLNFCKGATMDELEVHASQLVTARADGRKMVPYYDMINHRNGHWYNAQHYQTADSFSLVTNQKVEQGEQFYLSYNTCTICGSRVDRWGTPELFMDYGFVEPFPWRYQFTSVRLKFGLDEKKIGRHKDEKSKRNGDGHSGDELVVKWYVPPSQKGLDFLKTELDRLRKVNGIIGKQKEIPELEWNASWMLHQSMLIAFQAALEQAPAVSEEVWNMGDDDWYKDSSGLVQPNRFY